MKHVKGLHLFVQPRYHTIELSYDTRYHPETEASQMDFIGSHFLIIILQLFE